MSQNLKGTMYRVIHKAAKNPLLTVFAGNKVLSAL